MNQLVERLAVVRGLPVLIGVGLVVLNFVIRSVIFAFVPDPHEAGFLLFLFTDGHLFLHLGVVIGLLGVLIGDVL